MTRRHAVCAGDLSRSCGEAESAASELAIQYAQELVVLVVLMPVVFSLHHAQAHDCIIHLAY